MFVRRLCVVKVCDILLYRYGKVNTIIKILFCKKFCLKNPTKLPSVYYFGRQGEKKTFQTFYSTASYLVIVERLSKSMLCDFPFGYFCDKRSSHFMVERRQSEYRV